MLPRCGDCEEVEPDGRWENEQESVTEVDMKTKSGDRGSLRHINKPRPHFCVIWHQLNIRSHKDGNSGDATEVKAPSEQLALCHTFFSGGRVSFVQLSRLRLAKARCLTHSYLHRSWDRIKFSLTTKIENQGRAKVSCYCFLTDWVWVAGSLSKSTLLVRIPQIPSHLCPFRTLYPRWGLGFRHHPLHASRQVWKGNRELGRTWGLKWAHWPGSLDKAKLLPQLRGRLETQCPCPGALSPGVG